MFLPTTIDIGQSEKYTLSIRVKPNSFMFTLTEPNEVKNFCFRETSLENSISPLNNIQKIIYELNFLTQQFAKTNVVFANSDYNLVPTLLYDKTKKSELFDFTNSEKKGRVLVDENLRYKTENIYLVDEEIYEFLARSLYNPQFYHHTSLLVDLFEGKSKTTSLHSKMYVNFDGTRMDIFCFSENRHILSLSYDNLTTYEITYFILKTWESLNLDQMKDQLLIAGLLDEQVLATLRQYMKNIEKVATSSEIYLWHDDAQKTPLDLLSLSL